MTVKRVEKKRDLTRGKKSTATLEKRAAPAGFGAVTSLAHASHADDVTATWNRERDKDASIEDITRRLK